MHGPDDFDSVVSAQLPDKEMHPLLYALVRKHMLHKGCGRDHPDAPCMLAMINAASITLSVLMRRTVLLMMPIPSMLGMPKCNMTAPEMFMQLALDWHAQHKWPECDI